MSDLISRQDAIDALKEKVFHNLSDEFYGTMQLLEELPSAQPEQRWIPCSESLPEELVAVNITWVNHDPVLYYKDIKDKPFTATGVYFKGKWYWWSATVQDYLTEYGRYDFEEFDESIECIAWMPLPDAYEEDD